MIAQVPGYPQVQKRRLFSVLYLCLLLLSTTFAQAESPRFHYEVSFPTPAQHSYEVTLQVSNWSQDTILLKMPQWMPGYYQIMNYGESVEQFLAHDKKGKILPMEQVNNHSWRLSGIQEKPFSVHYTVRTSRQFVANSFVDSAHAYLIPGNTFLYAEDFLHTPVSVKLLPPPEWKDIATGLTPVPGQPYAFTAPDFDILYDCPLLLGKLEELPSFEVGGIVHRFVGYQIGDFDREGFRDKLQKIVAASVAIIGDIPYKQYTFIGIGPGRGGIEHLNNTTISFNGNSLNTPAAMNRMMNFLAHEYFHHYNVKRIRPFELGPFDYEHGNRTNLLWVSEGLSVYYEYLIVKRAGLVDEATLLSHFDQDLNAVENNPGRFHQSLQQASYQTWSDGPFGTQRKEPGQTISYYNKGPLVGMLLDFAIRNATQNERSLDEVMRLLYWKYYKEEQRGFTEAEFQQTCEQIAGISLTELFTYVNTTQPLDYEKYLTYAGLVLDKTVVESGDKAGTQQLSLQRMDELTPLQGSILDSWLGN